MRRAFVFAAILPLLQPTSSTAKGMTVRITISDVRTGTSVHITESAVLQHFNVWAGRGTFVTIGGRKTEGTTGFIVDWPAGTTAPPAGLARYEVKFFVRHHGSDGERLAYIVFYARDPASGQGFVYLPGRQDAEYQLNVKAIHRGNDVEGHWFRASAAWQRAADRRLPQR